VITRQAESAPGCGRRAGRAAAALAAGLAALLAFGGARAAAASLPAVHADPDRVIRDSHGRQVLLRGINVTALNDEFRVNARIRPVVPLRSRDYREMEAYGFNVIRLTVSWSKLEPRRGKIGHSYIDRIEDVVDEAADHGMYTVIDMHDGGWSKYVSTPPDEKCPRHFDPAHGYWGAPEWATFTDGQSTCTNDRVNKRTDAVEAAWFNFWTNHKEPTWSDGRGIQDHLVDVWGELGRRFANDSAVAGYDLLNEPDTGRVGPELDLSSLDGQFYAASVNAIRQGESAAGGYSHMVLFEPNLTWTKGKLSNHTPPPGFSSDPNLVFSPHLYGRDAHTTQRHYKSVVRDLKRQARRANRRASAYGTPIWIGEWAFSIFDTNAFKKLRAHVRIQDSRQLGSAWWQWKVACGSPGSFDGLDPKPNNEAVGNINAHKCPSGKPFPLPGGWKSLIARAYPRYAPGTLTELQARGARMSLRGRSDCNANLRSTDPQACRLVVWIPETRKYTHGGKHPTIDGRHVSGIHMQKLPGGWLLTGTVGGGAYGLHTR
jgi:endoglycosylceramidase